MARKLPFLAVILTDKGVVGMLQNPLFYLHVLFLVLVLGCTATFKPRVDSTQTGLSAAREVREGVEVSVREFVSVGRSRRAFDANIASEGVLALHVRLENTGVRNYRARRYQVRAFLGGQVLPTLEAYEAASQGASRSYILPALVNTAALGPLGMVLGLPVILGSTTHTRNVNEQVEHHFEAIEFTDVLLKPTDTAEGFVYFKLPNGLKRVENLMVEIALEVAPAEDQKGDVVYFRLRLPVLEIS